MASVKLESIRSLLEPLRVLKDRWGPSTFTALDRTQTNLERLNDKITKLESQLFALAPFASGPRVVVKRFFLTANLTVPVPDEPDGTVLIYVFKQDSAGGHTVSFPSPPFAGVFTNAVYTDADSITGFAFSKESENEIYPVLTSHTVI